MFIRTKKIKGKTYYYLVESYREGGKIKQRVIRYLGTKKPKDLIHKQICLASWENPKPKMRQVIRQPLSLEMVETDNMTIVIRR